MSELFDAVDIIRTKRDRQVLSDDQINWVIDAYTRGVVAEEQMSALAMAIFLNGMNPDEISTWTRAMINSGETMDFSSLSKPTSDKHSTGGVGDKITLPLSPLVATNPVDPSLLNMIPYIVTILAVAGFVGKSRAPASLNTPYLKS